MKIWIGLLPFVAVVVPAAAKSGSSPPIAPDIRYAAAAAWVKPPPSPTTAPTPPEAPVRVAYFDTQERITASGEDVFTAYRMKILKPEALPAGNVSVTWNPSAGQATVHYLRILRDGVPTDVLKTARFRIIQRENGLEQSILDGMLTATLQTPGLAVGDEIEFAVTIHQRDPTLGDHAFGVRQLPVQGTPGAFRLSVAWPATRGLMLKTSKDLAVVAPVTTGAEKAVVYELRDPVGAIATEGAPPRMDVRRLIEYSDFTTWRDVSRTVAPLYTKASQIAPGSPLGAEIAKIAAASSDPVARTEAALKLVQERVRYVYVGLNGGNYTPATADETWQRRFGDCKGKTVLLLAVLRELGIAAEPALVASNGGDGTNEHLPNPGLFDHVLVRARVGAASYWLDGTRMGDSYLDVVSPPIFRWALPLTAAGSDLEAVPARPFSLPQLVAIVDVDASSGFDKPAVAKVQHVLRGNEAYQIRTQLGAMSAEDGNRALKAYWRQQFDWVEAGEVTWRYDERHAALVLSMRGEGKPEWTGDALKGHSLVVYGAGFVPPDKLVRPKEQDQTAPWATEFPRYRCWATTIRLPAPGAKWYWTYAATPVDRTLGGVAYFRASGIRGTVLRTVMSREVLVPEISAAEATSVNTQIAGFDNNMSTVSQEANKNGVMTAERDPLPFGDTADWLGLQTACARPGR
ncbi:DUF3857 domain-containing transglutaminase family protein [Sphingomonas sp. 10B4]|uniref:DUF3857 domain-containing transglutaminase family protein n=1 Tax=Sphingomonas sp. 10B4 TaxID=3048575 RepID=UPI002B239B9B|nr:DUF3857 domain-containing transglutaminase family protein [Sphingomonas sp. 10B4]